MRKITIRRKAYRRKSFVAHRGRKKYRVKATKVPATVYKAVDRGKRGRGKKVIPTLKTGELSKHGYSFSKRASTRHRALVKSVKEDGYRTTISRLTALQVLFKRTNPKYSKIAKSDREWLRKNYSGSW